MRLLRRDLRASRGCGYTRRDTLAEVDRSEFRHLGNHSARSESVPISALSDLVVGIASA
jgi:hypothetical protein